MRCTAHGNQLTQTTDDGQRTTHFKSLLLPETQKHTFPAQKKVPFLVSMCKVSGWLAHKKNTVSSRVHKILPLQALDSAGMNLNRVRIKLREKENQLSA